MSTDTSGGGPTSSGGSSRAALGRADDAPPLVGRAEELTVLAAVSERVAATGTGHVVLVGGEAGIGKTRLLSELLHAAERLGFQVLRGAANELARRRPLGPLFDCLEIELESPDPQRAEIAALLAGDVSVGQLERLPPDSAVLEWRLVESTLALVEDLAATSLLAILLEDLQWADKASLLALHRLARRLAQSPILLVGSYRATPARQDLDQLLEVLRAAGAHDLHLKPLKPSAVEALVAALIGGQPGANLLCQVAGAAGNPFFVTELVRAIVREGALRPTGATSFDIDAVGLPVSLDVTILHRLSFLPERALEVLQLAAVLGSRVSPSDLAMVMQTSVVALSPLLRDCVRAGVLVEEDCRLLFRHDLIREALYRDLPEAVRRALHVEVSRVLLAAGAPVNRIAEHLMLGASAGDRGAVRLLHRAGRQVAPSAPAVAGELFSRAVELSDPTDPLREPLLADYALSLLWAGRLREAETICVDGLARRADASVAGVFRLCLVQVMLAAGRPLEALAETESAASKSSLPDWERAALEVWGAMARMIIGDLNGAWKQADAAAQAAAAVGIPEARAIALGVQAFVRGLQGFFRQALDLAQEGLVCTGPEPMIHLRPLFPELARAKVLMDIGEISLGQRALQEGRRIAEAANARNNLMMCHCVAGIGHFLAGLWDDAMTELDAGRDLAEEASSRNGAVMTFALRALVALHRGDVRAADEAVTAGLRVVGETGPQYGLEWLLWVQALVLDAECRPGEAFAVLVDAWTGCEQAGVGSARPTLGPDLVRLALGQGDKALAEAVVAGVDEISRREAVPDLQATALRCRGLLDGNPDVLVEAVSAFRGGQRPLALAEACEDAGVALARMGKVDEGARLLEEAVVIFEQLRAHRDVARAEASLRAAGVRRGQRGRRRRPSVGWESLTETELKVAELVAEGLSNPKIAERLFVSRGTVQTHVSHILTKLGVRSRVELAAQLAGRRREDRA